RCATNKLANPLNWDNNPAPAGPIYWSGRQDLNLRPLDPQDVEVSISTGQTGHKRRVHAWLTCGSSACVQVVWSPNGPQQDAPPIPYLPRPGRRSRRGAGVNGDEGHHDASKRHHSATRPWTMTRRIKKRG